MASSGVGRRPRAGGAGLTVLGACEVCDAPARAPANRTLTRYESKRRRQPGNTDSRSRQGAAEEGRTSRRVAADGHRSREDVVLLWPDASAVRYLRQASGEARHRLHRSIGMREEHVPPHAEPDERHHPWCPRHRQDHDRRQGSTASARPTRSSSSPTTCSRRRGSRT